MRNLPEGVQRAHDKYAAVEAERQAIADKATVETPVTATGKPYHQSIKEQDAAIARQAAYKSDFDALPTVAEAQAELLGTPTATLESVGVRAPTNVVDNARRGIDTEVASDAAAANRAQAIQYRNQIASTRRQLASFDVSDIEARRAEATAAAEKIGQRLPGGIAKDFDEQIRNRRADALGALKAIDTNARYLRSDERASAAAKELTRVSQLNTIPDIDKEFYNTMDAISAATNPAEVEALKGKLQLLEVVKARLEGAGTDVGTGRNYVEQFAEGGEVPLPEDMLELPEAVPTAPMQMDSGDYVIPVEALRFYGRKFFQGMIAKAEDAE